MHCLITISNLRTPKKVYWFSKMEYFVKVIFLNWESRVQFYPSAIHVTKTFYLENKKMSKNSQTVLCKPFILEEKNHIYFNAN